MKLVLGVDGGQSSTLALVATYEGQILGAGLAGPSNHIHEPGGLERLNKALHGSIYAALASAQQPIRAITHACLGMTGAWTTAGEITQKMMPEAQVQAHQDTDTALAGASLAQPGIVIIAGTGSVAYGQLADGRSAQSDGWGYFMGDDGSAYHIGWSALRAAARATDGRGEPTSLLTKIPAHFGLADLQEIHSAVYSQRLSRAQIARLASVVSAAALEGDILARKLLKQAGTDLAETILAAMKQLGVVETGITVYTTGGVFSAGDLILTSLRETVLAASPSSTIQHAHFNPATGAVLLALKAANIELSVQVIANMRATQPAAAIAKHQKRENETEKT